VKFTLNHLVFRLIFLVCLVVSIQVTAKTDMESRHVPPLGSHEMPVLVNHLPPRSGKLRTRPYWLWYVGGGVGYEMLDEQSSEVEDLFSTRSSLLGSSFTAGVLRTFGERFGASLNLDYGRRKDRFTIPKLATNGAVATTESSFAYFSNFSAMAKLNYLVPTRGCDYQVYAGVGYSILQNWTGSRVYREDSSQEIAYNISSPYETKNVSNRFRYTVGTRAAKSINEYIYLVFDTQVLLQTQYDIDDNGIEGFEIGNSVNVRLGVGYKLEKGRR